MSPAKKRTPLFIVIGAVIAYIIADLFLLKLLFNPSPAETDNSQPAEQAATQFTFEPGWVTKQNPASWMTCFYERGLENKLTLQDICIPATHDSAAYAVLGGGIQQFTAPWAITQDLNIGEQLRAGARKFDLRVVRTSNNANSGPDKDAYHIHHGGIKTATFEEVLTDISDYFSSPEAKNETLICRFTHFRGFSDSDDSKNLLANYIHTKLKDHLFIRKPGESMMRLPLKRYQNKVIILLGTQITNPPPGIHQLNGKDSIHVYDRYSNKDVAEAMITNQVNKFNQYNTDRELFMINWTLTPQVSGGIPKPVKTLAQSANSKLAETFADPKLTLSKPNPFGKSINVINVDFYGTIAKETLQACELIMSNRPWAQP